MKAQRPEYFRLNGSAGGVVDRSDDGVLATRSVMSYGEGQDVPAISGTAQGESVEPEQTRLRERDETEESSVLLAVRRRGEPNIRDLDVSDLRPL